MKNSKAWPGKQLRRRYASLRDCVIFMFVSQHGSCQVWNAPAVQRTHGFVMIGAVHECIITAVLPLLVRGTRSRNRLRGKADSPIRRSPSKFCATLDLSRGLRMDGRRPPLTLSVLARRTDAGSALIDSVREGIHFGRAAQQRRLRHCVMRDGSRRADIRLRILRRRAVAEEALQDVMVKIWERADQYVAYRGRAMAWITAFSKASSLTLADVRRLDCSPEAVGCEAEARGTLSARIPLTASIAT